MTDSRFAPYEPRRYSKPMSAITEVCDPEPALAIEQAPVAESEEAAREPVCESADAHTEAPLFRCERCAARAWDDDGVDPQLVRAAAIPLAAAACARALRYAIDRNPRLIVRFVEDVLTAAGAAARRA